MSNPVDAFENWYSRLRFGEQVDIALRLAYAVPEMMVLADSDPENVPGIVPSFLRAPHKRPIEIVARLGMLKALIDDICVPLSREDAQSFARARFVLEKARAQARDDEQGERFATLAANAADRVQEESTSFFVTWDDLVKGPLSPAAMYQWTFEAGNRPSPLLPPEAN